MLILYKYYRFMVWWFPYLSRELVRPTYLINFSEHSFTFPPFIVSVSMSLAASFIYLGAGLSVGLAGLAAGFAIGIVGDAGVRGTAQQPRLYVGMVRIFALYTSFVRTVSGSAC